MLGAAYASFAQGAYYARQQLVLAILVASALAGALVHRRLTASELRLAPVAGAVALAACALLSGAAASDVRGAAFPVGLAIGVAATVVVVRRLDDEARARLLDALVWLGALVAGTGWIAVAYRLHPYALEDQRLWRAATTLTYANAAAGLLVPLTLVAAARRVQRPEARDGALALFALLAGVGATLSRGGLVALLVGGAVLAAAAGPRRTATAVAAPLLGALVALAALVPSMPAAASPHPALAWTGVAAGAAIALAAPALGWRRTALAVALALGAGVALAPGPLRAPVSAVATGRASLASQDRVDETVAAWRLAGTRPVLGVGPGHFLLHYQAGDGRGPLLARYAHNEYVQTLAVLGVVGLAVLLAAGAGTAAALRRARRGPSDLRWAGVVAGLSAFAVHSSLDFLWHVPALPLVAAVLLGSALPQPSPDPSTTTSKETS